ncbi:hypothetical protein MRX96_056950 [Rhipicephalus microplus]
MATTQESRDESGELIVESLPVVKPPSTTALFESFVLSEHATVVEGWCGSASKESLTLEGSGHACESPYPK